MRTSKTKVALITSMILHSNWRDVFNFCLQLGINPLLLTEELAGTYLLGEGTATLERKIKQAIEGVPNVKS